MNAPNVRKHVAIALVSACVLLVQIAVTRLLSSLLSYHWAFSAVSLSMLGAVAPGLWLTLTDRRPPLDRVLLAAGLLVPAGVAALVHGQPYVEGYGVAFSVICLLPSLACLGTALCLLLLEADGAELGRRYGGERLGACTGALAVVPLLERLGTPELAACAGFLPLLAHELLAEEARRWPGRLAAVALGASVALGLPYRVEATKLDAHAGPRTPMLARWTPTARLAIFPSPPSSDESFPGGMGTNAPNAPAPEVLWLAEDASAGTPIVRFDGDASHVQQLLYDVRSVAYQLGRPARVAVVGAGGGRDVLTAHLAGASTIDAIELNAGLVATMRRELAGFSGGVYDLPGVTAVVGDGRGVLARSAGGYDVIQLAMTDSSAASPAGAFSLPENGVYTVEAYRLYFSRLARDGVVSTSRSMAVGFGFEVQRLLLLIKTALVEEGVDEPLRHLAVIEAGKVATVLVSRSPLSRERVARLHEVANERGFTVPLPAAPNTPVPQHLTSILERGAASFEQQGFALAPPTDDSPFFFQMISPFRVPSVPLVEKLGIAAASVKTLRTLLTAVAGLTLALLLAPLFARRRLARGPSLWVGSAYFLALGVAFAVLELCWLQRAVLYLGHPSLATTAALGFVLLGAAAGSLVARHVTLAAAERWGFVLAGATMAVHLLLQPVFTRTLGAPVAVRLVLTGALLAPPAVLMGVAFPLGMRAFGDGPKSWFWAVHGAGTVLATVATVALAMRQGLLRTGLFGGGCYLAAWLLMRERERGRAIRKAAVALAALPLALTSASLFASLVEMMRARVRYPIDLEWMEGGQLLMADRLLRGLPLYDACSDGYIPFAYPPVHAAFVALAAKLFGLEYPVARMVSILGFALVCALLAGEAHRVAGRGTRGAFAALATLGWLAASYPTSGAWYDLVRVDSTCMGLLTAGIVLSLPPHGARPRARLSGTRTVFAAVLLVGAAFAKQSAVLFLPWIVAFSVAREWRSGLRLGALVGALAAGSLLIANRASHGMFWILVFDVMGHHPLLPELFRSALLTLAFFAPFVVLLPPVAGWLFLKRKLPIRVVFWVGLALNATVVSLFTCSKVGAYINNIMTATIFVPAATIMLGAALLDSMPRRSALRGAIAAAGVLTLGYLLSAQHIHRAEVVPSRREWDTAVSLIRYVRDLPGTVLFPAHPYLPRRLGKAGRQAHEQGYVDVVGSPIESIDLATCAANLDGDFLIVNDKTDPRFLELLEVAYEPVDELPRTARMVIGKFTQPAKLYARRRGDSWQAARANRRKLFDFESGELGGWTRSGKAFVPGASVALLDHQQPVSGHAGHFFVNSYHPSLLDEATGTATSPPFAIDRARLGFRAGGGASHRLRVELVVDGVVVRSLEGTGRSMVEQLVPVVWDVTEWLGREGRIVLRDDDGGDWGHLLVDAFELFDPAGT
ncbi:MAG: hypothetical protein FJ095_02425 [Deltaproteobacteria bacterium]|nr:hypothetical protein [Deltaproteobacteria bacterium]